MLTPLEVASKAEKLADQNFKFRSFLKNRADDDELDAQFLALHKELFSSYDCRKCNNCCKMYQTGVSDAEITAISSFLGQTEDSFIKEYLIKEKDEFGLGGYVIKEMPCSFLQDDGHCRIRDCKPASCKGYPYTDQPDRLSSMLSIIGFAEVCPVVFEMLERLKVIYRFLPLPRNLT